jgi:glutamyl-Q tRNA(Asp) synthetase
VSDTPFVTRFAPSPTGRLHLGHAFSALTAFEAAREAGGRFLLRIDDIDATRARPAFEQAIYEDLAGLGLAWERPVRRQSEHLADYVSALERLQAMGVLYRCFRTRRELAQAAQSAPHGSQTPFTAGPHAPDDEAARLAAGEPFAWRLSVAAARTRLGAAFDRLTAEADGAATPVDPSAAGDVVLARKDVGVAYHLACVVDDAAQGVTCVIRGEDLRDALPMQRLLQALLDLPTPTYRHHPLVLGADGKRLAKRDGAPTLAALREAGTPPPRTARDAWRLGEALSGVVSRRDP